MSGARPEHAGKTRPRRPLGLTRAARSLAAASTVLIVGSVVAACGSSPKANAPPSTPPPLPSTTQPTPTTVNYRHPTYAPPASLWPKSIFSKPDVANWPLVSASSKFASDIVADYTQDYGSVGVNSMPVYRVPADQPDVPVSVLSGCNNFLPDTGDRDPHPTVRDAERLE